MSWWSRPAMAVAWVGCASGCLYDSSNRCGSHQVLEHEICVCESAFTLDGNTCKVAPKPPASDGGSGDASDTGHGYTGQKAPCSSDADCKGFDASFCNLQNMYCIVPDCSADSCDPGWTCTDLSKFVPGLPKACTFDADQPG